MTRGLKVARYRFIHGGQGRIELYDEIEDPREQKDLARERPIALRQMRNVFGLLYAYEANAGASGPGARRRTSPMCFYSEVGGR